MCLSTVTAYLFCRQKPGKGQCLLVCLVKSRWNMSLSKDPALPLLEPCKDWFDMSHLLLSFRHKGMKTNELEATLNTSHVTSDTCMPGEVGTAVTVSSSGPVPSQGWPSWSLPQSRHWLWSPRPCGLGKATTGWEGMWDGSQAKNDGWWSHSPVLSSFWKRSAKLTRERTQPSAAETESDVTGEESEENWRKT